MMTVHVFLVEAIAKKSQNIKWETSVDNQKVGHMLIRRVSMDKFYAGRCFLSDMHALTRSNPS